VPLALLLSKKLTNHSQPLLRLWLVNLLLLQPHPLLLLLIVNHAWQ